MSRLVPVLEFGANTCEICVYAREMPMAMAVRGCSSGRGLDGICCRTRTWKARRNELGSCKKMTSALHPLKMRLRSPTGSFGLISSQQRPLPAKLSRSSGRSKWRIRRNAHSHALPKHKDLILDVSKCLWMNPWRMVRAGGEE